MGIKDLIDQLAEKRAESRISPEESDPRVRAGVEALVRNAKVAVDEIGQQYKDSVMGHVVLVAVSGPSSKEFADMSAAKLNTLAVDFKYIEKVLIENLITRKAGERYGQNEHFLLLDEFNRLRIEYKFVLLPAPKVERYNDGVYEAPLAQAVSTLIKNNYQTSLFSAVTRRLIGQLALEKEFVGKFLPVVLYNYEGPVDAKMLPAPTLELEVSGKVTEKAVKTAMNEVRAKLVGNKQTDPDMGLIEGEESNEQ